MNPSHELQEALDRCPLVAILRGVQPEQALEVGTALVEVGFTIIEVPMNSPSPLKSIRYLSALSDRALIGAGTVTRAGQAQRVRDAGGRLAVSPHTDPVLIQSCKEAGLIAVPGFLTPSEALQALAAGADALKLFPCEIASPSMLGALAQVLPKGIPILAVGGISSTNLHEYGLKGASGFEIGGALYRPDRSMGEILRRARQLLACVEHFPGSAGNGR